MEPERKGDFVLTHPVPGGDDFWEINKADQNLIQVKKQCPHAQEIVQMAWAKITESSAI